MTPYYVKGTITAKENGSLTIENNGFGYRFLIPMTCSLDVGSETTLFISEYVYEERRIYVAFTNEKELRFFEMLLAVKGIGPKTALSMISKCGVEDLEMLIGEGDSGRLSSATGLGPRSSIEVIASIKGKLKRRKIDRRRPQSVLSVLDALRALGFKETEIDQALGNDYAELDQKELMRRTLQRLRKEDTCEKHTKKRTQ